MDAETGISMEQYYSTGETLGTLQSYIIVNTTGGIIIEAGTTSIEMTKDGDIVLTVGDSTITMDGSTVDVV
jgi:hypothetical protein